MIMQKSSNLLVPLTGHFASELTQYVQHLTTIVDKITLSVLKCECKTCKRQHTFILQKCHHRHVFSVKLKWELLLNSIVCYIVV